MMLRDTVHLRYGRPSRGLSPRSLNESFFFPNARSHVESILPLRRAVAHDTRGGSNKTTSASPGPFPQASAISRHKPVKQWHQLTGWQKVRRGGENVQSTLVIVTGALILLSELNRA